MKTILALLVVLAFIVSGCSSSTPEQNLNTVDSSKTDSVGTSQTGDETVSKTETTVSNANSKLKGILSSTVKYKVTYDITSVGTTSQMTQYISGDKVRIDMTSDGMEIQSYYLNSEYVVCNKATGNWMCQKMTYTPSATDDVKKNVESYDVQSIGTKMVAGVTADCYKITTKDGAVEYCYSKDNVPLYIKTTSGAISSEMTAKSYSTSVSDADFIAPAKVGAAISTNPADYMNPVPGTG